MFKMLIIKSRYCNERSDIYINENFYVESYYILEILIKFESINLYSLNYIIIKLF